MSRSPKAEIESSILLWAREESGLTVETAARRVGTKPERVHNWEDGSSFPSVKQLRKLAKAYMRPIGLFFLPVLPEEPERIKDFRRIADVEKEMSSALRFEIRLALERRYEALDIASDLGEEPKLLQCRFRVGDQPEQVAREIREILGISIESQFRWRTKRHAFNSWRAALERLGLLLFQTGVKRNLIVSPEEARGFSVSDQPFPVIVVNGRDHPSAKCFTLIHEFTHVLLHDGGLCDLHNPFTARSEIDRTEVFCNAVAGSVLVPEGDLLNSAVVRNHGSDPVWSDEELGELAQTFWVSWEVILRRLLIFDRTSRDYYQRWRKERNDMFPGREEPKGDRTPKIPTHTRVIIRNGKSFPRLVLRGLRNNCLTTSEASEFLDAPPHRLIDVENAVF